MRLLGTPVYKGKKKVGLPRRGVKQTSPTTYKHNRNTWINRHIRRK